MKRLLFLLPAVLAGALLAAPALGQAAPGAYRPVPQIENCGFMVAGRDAAPERVLTIKSTATEMLLALGLGDRIVGKAFQDGPAAAEWAEADGRIPVVAERVPNLETVLRLAPDFIYAGWESNLTPEGAGGREELRAFGIETYVSPAACRGAGQRPGKLGFDDVFAQIAEIGAIFGVPTRAAEVIEEQRAALAAVAPAAPGQSAVWYSSGVATPYVGAGMGAPQMIMEALGLRNIADGIEEAWASMSWEAVAAADPDIIILVDAAWNKASSKIKHLESDPALSAMRAVREKRYLIVPFAASEAGVRNVPAVVDMAAQLARLPAGR